MRGCKKEVQPVMWEFTGHAPSLAAGFVDKTKQSAAGAGEKVRAFRKKKDAKK